MTPLEAQKQVLIDRGNAVVRDSYLGLAPSSRHALKVEIMRLCGDASPDDDARRLIYLLAMYGATVIESE